MADLLVPDWPAPARVRAVQTGRAGGCSRAPWDSFNLGDHVGDDPAAVAANRATLRARLPAEPLWLSQVHGNVVVDARNPDTVEADAAFARQSGVVCVVMTADCLPVLFCDQGGAVVAAAHAGWRGLVGGVLEATVAAMDVPADQLLVWLGPAIGPSAFEVGDEVRAAFVADDPGSGEAFVRHGPGKWLADLYGLARRRLQRIGVPAIYGGEACTVSQPDHYFSYRRDGVTGRMATLIWLADDDGV
ncbi:peptidoglycan editing factor PgeF [Dechloromonas sp. HYN0024]|uniref:peptidoglycan editing factor PgeF n=1 Tax=Dechloromonas sp. HYN0024 TaxID=2231055 RepID=UPI000E44DE25|nr:peptidoglycan editing factor PgeF [Dechloromonas sp. HYN0024]AXS80213.1 peptidoglycan editing factor PgeF [Dechloromonas sp. HYN0024]